MCFHLYGITLYFTYDLQVEPSRKNCKVPKIPFACTLSASAAKVITVNWIGSPPASFSDSTIMLSQCGSDENTNTYQSATYRITIESSTQFKMQYANSRTSGSGTYTGTIVCYLIIWGV